MYLTRIRESAKAIVAVVTPIISTLVVDLLADVSRDSEVGIAAVATAILVWLVPNTKAEEV